MSEEYGNGSDARDGARLWARARPGWRAAIPPETSGEVPDPSMLAAYLDDTLDEAERATVEAWMAADPEALELMIAARAESGQAPGPVPESLISRAQGLVRAPVPEHTGLGAWLRGLVGFEPAAWRLVAWAGVTAVLLVVSAGSFELGRLGTEQLAQTQSAAIGDDLEFGLDDSAEDLI
jgi:anti-sigma factor RsiW